MQLVCDKSTALVSKMRVGTNSEIDLLDNVDFSSTDNDITTTNNNNDDNNNDNSISTISEYEFG